MEGVAEVSGLVTDQVLLEPVDAPAVLSHDGFIRREDAPSLVAPYLPAVAWGGVRVVDAGFRRGLARVYGRGDVEAFAPLAQALDVLEAEAGQEDGALLVGEGGGVSHVLGGVRE